MNNRHPIQCKARCARMCAKVSIENERRQWMAEKRACVSQLQREKSAQDEAKE